LTIEQVRADLGKPSGREVKLDDLVGANLRMWLTIDEVVYGVFQAGSAMYLYCPSTCKAYRQPMAFADWIVHGVEACGSTAK
jgi:hypothetical protein